MQVMNYDDLESIALFLETNSFTGVSFFHDEFTVITAQSNDKLL